MDIEHQLVSSIPPDEMGDYLRWMIPAMNTPARVGLLSSMKAGAPREEFERTRELARTLLSPMDAAALTMGPGSAA